MEHKIIQEVLYKWPYNVCAIWIWKYTKLSLNDRLEVTSPGGLYNGLTYEEVMNGHSKIRNKGIANIFSDSGNLKITNLDRLIFTKNGEFTI